MTRLPAVLLTVSLLASSLAAQVAPPSEESIEFFRQNCASCHTIGGGPLAGPDLKDLSKRRPRDWSIAFVLDPKRVIDSGDPYAQKIFREARGVYMQKIPGLTKPLVTKLLDLIDAESVAEKPRFAGSPADDRPLTQADIDRGRRIFVGHEALAAGGPSCISCHTVESLSGLAGGRLGPDLTNAYARLEGRKALAAWLSSPPSEVMKPIYKRHRLEDDERLALVAYLKSIAARGEPVRSSILYFVLAGFGAAALILVAFDFLWRNRYREVRKPLVAGLTRSTAR